MNGTNSTNNYLSTVFVTTNTALSFIVYNILFVLTTIICCGKLAPCATIFHCFKHKISFSAPLWNHARRTPLFVSLVLEIVVLYIFFRVITSANEVTYYSLLFLNTFSAPEWVFTVFVGIFVKSGLIWIFDNKLRISLLVFSHVLFVAMSMVIFLLMLISMSLYLWYPRIYIYFTGFGTASVYVICSVVLTFITGLVSLSLIGIIASSSRPRKNAVSSKMISSKQKMEQSIMVFKLIIAGIFFFISNCVRFLGLILYVLGYYYYAIVVMRTIPDMFIILGICCVFWPFSLVPKGLENKSKIAKLLHQVTNAYDMIDQFEELPETSSETPSTPPTPSEEITAT